MTLAETVQNHAFTAGLTESQLARLAGIVKEADLAENELVLQARQQSRTFTCC